MCKHKHEDIIKPTVTREARKKELQAELDAIRKAEEAEVAAAKAIREELITKAAPHLLPLLPDGSREKILLQELVEDGWPYQLDDVQIVVITKRETYEHKRY